MSIQPLRDSVITLYRNVEISSGRTLVFNTSAAREAYFTNHAYINRVNCSYVEVNKNRVELDVSKADADKCNYLSFRNPDYENKIIYAKIKNIPTYINDGVTAVDYEIDYWMTDMFNSTYQPSMIEREHLSQNDTTKVNNDPWRNDVYELLTEENLPVSPAMQRFPNVNEIHTIGEGDMVVLMALTPPAQKYDAGLYSQWIDVYTANADAVYHPSGKSYVVNPSLFPSDGSKMKLARATQILCFIIHVKTPSMIAKVGERVTNCLDFLAFNNLTHTITQAPVLIPYRFLRAWLDGSSSVDYFPRPSTGKYRNKKLLRSPYTYMEINSMSNSKELQFENFTQTDGQGNVGLSVVSLLDSIPTTAIVPNCYKATFPAGSSGNPRCGNLRERLEISGGDIPLIPFSVDSYLAFIGEQYSKAYSGTTARDLEISTNKSRSDIARGSAGYAVEGTPAGEFNGGLTLSKTLSLAKDTAKEALGIAPAGTVANNMLESAQAYSDTMNAYDMAVASRQWGESQLASTDNGVVEIRGDQVDNVFGTAKRSNACRTYTPGSGNFLGLYSGYDTSPIPVEIVCKQLNDSIAAQYDQYFTKYGYTSNRVGVPRVCYYVGGSADASVLPTFMDGETYVKTKNMKVVNGNKESESYIEGIFNTGHHFKRG